MTEVFFYVFFVCAGSLLGLTARYLATRAMKGNRRDFLWIKLTINAVCCFIIGISWGLFVKTLSESYQISVLLSVGFLAGFNPIYAAVNESVSLVRGGRYMDVLLYPLGKIALCILSGIAGFALAQ